ncbi:hypothetical protein PENTCL1PPCAC_7801, partial [Pristionchus entomophagus]
MNWLGVFALILLLNTLLLASILGFFVIHHLTTNNPPPPAAPAATTAAAALTVLDTSLLLSDPLTVPFPPCPICSPTNIIHTTTVTESKATTTVTTPTTVDVDSQKLLFKLLDAYLETNRNHASQHFSYDSPPSRSPEIYPGMVEGNAVYEELLKKLKLAESKMGHGYDSAPPYPVGSSAVCSMQLDVETVSKCSIW